MQSLFLAGVGMEMVNSVGRQEYSYPDNNKGNTKDECTLEDVQCPLCVTSASETKSVVQFNGKRFENISCLSWVDWATTKACLGGMLASEERKDIWNNMDEMLEQASWIEQELLQAIEDLDVRIQEGTKSSTDMQAENQRLLILLERERKENESMHFELESLRKSSKYTSIVSFSSAEENMVFGDDDDDREVAAALFQEIDLNKGGKISLQALVRALEDRKNAENDDLLSSFQDMARESAGRQTQKGLHVSNSHEPGPGCARPDSDYHFTFEEFLVIFRDLPRTRAARTGWARSLGLDGELARLIPVGDVWDGLKALRNLEGAELDTVVSYLSEQFVSLAPSIIRNGVIGLRKPDAKYEAGSVDTVVNSKFAMDGAYLGRFATLDDFYKGPEERIGTPNPRIREGCEKEHLVRKNAFKPFETSNYGLTTWPAQEWEFVVCPRMDYQYPHTPVDKTLWPSNCGWRGEHGREIISLETLLAKPEVKRWRTLAELCEEELICLRLYTGPMFVLYNASLRGFPSKDVDCLLSENGKSMNKYETTIFCIASGVTKLSKVTPIPLNRKLYRGLGGMILPDQFWKRLSECQVSIVLDCASRELVGKALEMLEWGFQSNRPRSILDRLKHGRLARSALDARNTDVGGAAGLERMFLELPGHQNGWLGPGRVRVVDEAKVEDCRIRVVLAVGISKADLSDEKRRHMCGALEATCGLEGGIQAKVESVADKPGDFLGGVEFGLMSTTTARDTAIMYSGLRDKRATLFEIQAGRVDVGANIKFLSQYPGEEEYLMPPLSCLEVAGNPWVDKVFDGKSFSELVVLPMRVNVNLKSATTDDLLRRRKMLHMATANNLREELQYHLETNLDGVLEMLMSRAAGELEFLTPKPELSKLLENKTSSFCFDCNNWLTVGAPYAIAREGALYFEVEVLDVQGGYLHIGLAGASVHDCDLAGLDEKSWTVFTSGSGFHSGQWRTSGLDTEWFVPSGVLCLALDLSTGQMFARSGRGTGIPWVMCHEGIRPSRSVGPGVFPVVCGRYGCSVRVHLDAPIQGDMPPISSSMQFRSFLDAAAWRPPATVDALLRVLDELASSPAVLMKHFDQIRQNHQDMDPQEFNVDHTYKDLMVEVLDIKRGIATKQEAVLSLMREGASPAQLSVLRDAPPSEFLEWQPLEMVCHRENSWRMILAGWFDHVEEATVPVGLTPCQASVLWSAILSPSSAVTTVILKDAQSTLALNIPQALQNFDAKALGLHHKKYGTSVLGLFQGLHSLVEAEKPRLLARADVRDVEYSEECKLALSSALANCCLDDVLGWVNGLSWNQGPELSDTIPVLMDGRELEHILGQGCFWAAELACVCRALADHGASSCSLRNEGLGPDSAVWIASALQRFSTLSTLDLG